ncbi:hypothetical protein HYE67_001373 [Fusarium culmorum]|uniref:Uncharacterized protein n=1 Tax=Fusarium culmorum TaxID=5516 RepID=A0A2T4GTE0_FUSCU|nr:hypothetical protein FCULG_00005510 [Fusarium culmorum]QPC59142.1 hypothetical protein HYE67_001373 [Fusarium culmorum]
MMDPEAIGLMLLVTTSGRMLFLDRHDIAFVANRLHEVTNLYIRRTRRSVRRKLQTTEAPHKLYGYARKGCIEQRSPDDVG